MTRERRGVMKGRMRGQVLGLLLPLLAACAGKNTVAGEDASKQQQLQDSIPNWCVKACEHIRACGIEPDCSCNSGQSCDCPGGVGTTCESSCKRTMQAIADKGETCANAGLRFESCFEAAACATLDKEETCMPSSAAEKACFPEASVEVNMGGSVSAAGSANGNPGSSSDQPMASGGTTSSGGGSGDPGSGGASGGTTGGSTGAPLVTCSETYGGGPAPGADTSVEICDGGAATCSDGHVYRYLCGSTSDGHSACSCFLDDDVTGAFDPHGRCPTSDEINLGCGWNVNGIGFMDHVGAK